jgi:ATP-dependent Clp protease ATP-binding subunit ClpA
MKKTHVQLDMADMVAGANYRGEFDERSKQLS